LTSPDIVETNSRRRAALVNDSETERLTVERVVAAAIPDGAALQAI
jgi:hypothetical protein